MLDVMFLQRQTMNDSNSICCLCGNALGKDIDRDHVPPKQFYSTNIRKKHSPNLFTIPVHSKCNKSYQKDEDYFVFSIGPFAKGSYAGNGIWDDIANRAKRVEAKKISQMILSEFDNRPSGLYLPGDKVIKRFDPDRVWRVIWKIVRGLFFKEYKRFLPERTPRFFKFYSIDEVLPPEFPVVRDTKPRGQYPKIFDYKYISFSDEDNFHLWAFLLWSRLIIIIGFHDPDCLCEECSKIIEKENITKFQPTQKAGRLIKRLEFKV
jgi:hypothetical protein